MLTAKKRMKATDKWVVVDDQFKGKYPQLYEKIIHQVQFDRDYPKKSQQMPNQPDPEYDVRIQVGISSAGNIKILQDTNYLIVLKKEELMEGLFRDEYIQYAADFGKPVPVDIAQRDKWRNLLDVTEIEVKILPYLRTRIRQELGKPDWKFDLHVQITWKKKSFLCHLKFQANEFPTVLERQLSSSRLCMYKDLDSTRPFFEEVTDDLIAEIKKEQMDRNSQQLKDIISKNWEKVKEGMQKQVDISLKQMEKNGTVLSGHVQTDMSNAVVITFPYIGMSFTIKRLAKQAVSSFFMETSWLTPYQTITKRNDHLTDLIMVDFDAALEAKLPKFAKKLDQELKNGIPLDAPFVNRENVYSKELEDRAKAYNQWKISWLDGYKSDMNSPVTGKLYVDKQEVVFKSESGTITVTQNSEKYVPSEQFKEYRLLQNTKLYGRCRQYALDAFAEFGQIRCQKGSTGILNGDTVLILNVDGISEISYHYNTASYRESVPEWKKTLTKNLQELRKKVEETRNERKIALRKQYRYYLESYLAKDILECVSANEKYITQTAVTQILRGTQVALNAPITLSHGSGQYRLYKADFVSDVIERMVQTGILTTVTCKGTYGRFEILKIASRTKDDLVSLKALVVEEQQNWSNKKQDQIQKSLRSNVAISDSEAEQYLLHAILQRDGELDSGAYLDLINLVSHPIVLAMHEEDVRKCFANAPEMVVKFLKMRHKNANTQEKKIMKRFLL